MTSEFDAFADTLWPMATASELTDAPAAAPDDDEPEAPRQLSLPRVMFSILLVAAVFAVGFVAVRRTLTATAAVAPASTWFAPYVDATLTPIAQFQDPGLNVARQVALGFIVADPQQGCQPSWGGYYNLDAASSTLNMDSRIAQMRAQGGDVVVSFGGQANSELALTCSDPVALQKAYASVINRYHLSTVDFDIEGAALADTASIQRRAVALAALQKSERAQGKNLAVWLTLPVATNGLANNALSVVTTTLGAGVVLSGVNVMAMDFGGPEPDMGATVRSALAAAHDQLYATYRRYDTAITSGEVWNRMGVTVMIGQNDTAEEIFTVANAQAVTAYAKAQHLGRVSMWSLNRDQQCGTAFAEIGVHSNTCSGTEQQNLQFSKVFAAFTGSAAQGLTSSGAGSSTSSATSTQPVDNPATSPYPIWQATRPYVKGYKVVRLGEIYEAQWYTQGDDPAAQEANSPWQLIGPVLPGDQAPTTTTLAPGTYPVWSPVTAYTEGQQVLYDGLPYQAKWYNQATSPGAEDANPSTSPWQPLFTVPGEPTGS